MLLPHRMNSRRGLLLCVTHARDRVQSSPPRRSLKGDQRWPGVRDGGQWLFLQSTLCGFTDDQGEASACGPRAWKARKVVVGPSRSFLENNTDSELWCVFTSCQTLCAVHHLPSFSQPTNDVTSGSNRGRKLFGPITASGKPGGKPGSVTPEPKSLTNTL